MNEKKELTHIDLFSGIGGFTLAGEWAGFKTIVFCEKEKFCQKVLKKHWPKIPIVEEIRDFDGAKWRGATLLTGGFPCQPFSVAGQRKGKEDDRYLWPEMLKIINETKPHWILAENVPGIFRMALDTVLSDLESEGYSTGLFIIPACGLNAPHRRYRVWIIAHSGCEYGKRTKDKEKFERQISEKENASLLERSIKNDRFRNIADSEKKRVQGNWSEGKQEPKGHVEKTLSECHDCGTWQENWLEIAARFCRVDDGVSDRIHRLKALGNTIVPQVAYEILKNIAWVERRLNEEKKDR